MGNGISLMNTQDLKTFMENLWDARGMTVPGLGEIVEVRCKYGDDLQATFEDSNGEVSLWDGSELYERWPQMFT
ncbi:MAG: hypothetical protein ACO3MB_11475 [Saprospiraceae bacterium]